MVRKLIGDDRGLGNVTWVLLVAALAIGAVMYFPQLGFVTAGLGRFWAWLSLPFAGG